MATHFERLSSAYAITVGGRLLPGAGGYGMGAVAPVAPNERAAQKFIEEQKEPLQELGRGAPDIVPVGDPWQFMRRAASEGLAGIEGAIPAEYPERFMFMVRVEEAGVPLPTVLTSISEHGWALSLTRGGVRRMEHAELLHWARHDVLDNVMGEWGQRCPFRSWDHGDPLYELATDDIVVLLANVPLLGDWNSIDGAVAFFTSEADAYHYQRFHLADGRNQMWLSGPNAPRGAREAMGSLRPRSVADLRVRLAELRALLPFAAWCVNPDGHRENAGCGRLLVDGESDRGGQFHMSAVSGVWTVSADNVFLLKHSMAPWSGSDTIRWSGGQGIQLLPLRRSFELEGGDGEFGSLTESEIDEEVDNLFAEMDSDASVNHADEEAVEGRELADFYLACWDSVTGDGGDTPWQFPRFLDAVRALAEFEQEHDRVHRIDGAVSCSHIGFSGSGDSEFESLRSSRFQRGLRRIARRVLVRGYAPTDADDLVALCNQTLRTLHVEFAGFAKDLLWASSSDQEADLLAKLGIEDRSWREWSQSADAEVDPRGKLLVIDRIGDAAWARLLPKVRQFLATALIHLEENGNAPQLDFAPVSVEVVKALEAELGRLLEAFRVAVEPEALMYEIDDFAEKSLAAFLGGGKAPTMGAISHLFRKSRGESSLLRQALHRFLEALPNGEFLMSDAFAKTGLQRVINKFRNGGAHDSAIRESVCRECVEVLIGDSAKPGYIPKVTAWQ